MELTEFENRPFVVVGVTAFGEYFNMGEFDTRPPAAKKADHVRKDGWYHCWSGGAPFAIALSKVYVFPKLSWDKGMRPTH